MQINESKIAFICFLLFFRIGTFQWVTDDSNKKICACVTLYLKCNNRISLLSSRSRQKRGFDPAIGKTYNTDFLVWQGNAYARGFKERLFVIVGGGGQRGDFCTICDFLAKMDFGKATASSPARSRSSRHWKSCSMLNNIEVALVAVVRMLRAVRPSWPTVCTRRSAEKAITFPLAIRTVEYRTSFPCASRSVLLENVARAFSH
jgi:hypothetical protein